MPAFEVFKSFYAEKDAKQFLEILRDNNIEYAVEKHRIHLDKIIIGDDLMPEYHLKINPDDFDKANKAIDSVISSGVTEIEPDYYLYEFTDDELIEVVRKPDEWNNQDVIIARKILSDRGIVYSDKDMSNIRAERIEELKKPYQERTATLLDGYLLAIVVGPIGIFYSLYKLTAKRILPDGRKVHVFDAFSRRHFRIMLFLSVTETTLLFLGFSKLYLELGRLIT
jgi:hypothetical protein